MLESPFTFEGQTITVDGVEIEATCGPERKEPFERFDGALVASMKVVGELTDLPMIEGERVDINGVEWEVESSTVVSTTAIVTFIRYLG